MTPKQSTEGGQRVTDPIAVLGDDPAAGTPEPDPAQLKDAMANASKGTDDKLEQDEQQAKGDRVAAAPERRQNDAGQ
jgi:hypothetical protein